MHSKQTILVIQGIRSPYTNYNFNSKKENIIISTFALESSDSIEARCFVCSKSRQVYKNGESPTIIFICCRLPASFAPLSMLFAVIVVAHFPNFVHKWMNVNSSCMCILAFNSLLYMFGACTQKAEHTADISFMISRCWYWEGVQCTPHTEYIGESREYSDAWLWIIRRCMVMTYSRQFGWEVGDLCACYAEMEIPFLVQGRMVTVWHRFCGMVARAFHIICIL